MKSTSKATEFLKRAVIAFKSKARILRARLLFLASLRRRTAVVGALSHKIHALMSGREKAMVDHGKALAARGAVTVEDDVDVRRYSHGAIDLSELALFQEDEDGGGDGYPDWTHSLFEADPDDDGVGDEHRDGGHDAWNDGDEPSVMDIIRSSREDNGLEFNMEDEIDHAADLFIRRCRTRMNRSF